jgi:hypothetical protein
MVHEEPFALKAVIAIGALTLSTHVTSASMKPKFSGPIARRHYDNALRQYGKALRLMQEIHNQDDP